MMHLRTLDPARANAAARIASRRQLEAGSESSEQMRALPDIATGR